MFLLLIFNFSNIQSVFICLFTWRASCLCIPSHLVRSFSGGSFGKESACNAGDLGLIPGLGSSPGEGKGNLLQYSCLWRIPWTKEPSRLQPMGSQRVRHDWETNTSIEILVLVIKILISKNYFSSSVFFVESCIAIFSWFIDIGSSLTSLMMFIIYFEFLFCALSFLILFILGCAGSSWLQRLSSRCGERGLLSSCGMWASHCTGFSLQGTGSTLEHRPSSCGTWD